MSNEPCQKHPLFHVSEGWLYDWSAKIDMSIQALASNKHLLLSALYLYIHLNYLKYISEDWYDNSSVGIGEKSMITTCSTLATLGATLNF